MSAIVAGKSCKKCEKEYWVCFGHPKWYDDVILRGLNPSNEFKEFEALVGSGMCPACFLKIHESGKLKGSEILVKRDKK